MDKERSWSLGGDGDGSAIKAPLIAALFGHSPGRLLSSDPGSPRSLISPVMSPRGGGGGGGGFSSPRLSGKRSPLLESSGGRSSSGGRPRGSSRDSSGRPRGSSRDSSDTSAGLRTDSLGSIVRAHSGLGKHGKTSTGKGSKKKGRRVIGRRGSSGNTSSSASKWKGGGKKRSSERMTPIISSDSSLVTQLGYEGVSMLPATSSSGDLRHEVERLLEMRWEEAMGDLVRIRQAQAREMEQVRQGVVAELAALKNGVLDELNMLRIATAEKVQGMQDELGILVNIRAELMEELEQLEEKVKLEDERLEMKKAEMARLEKDMWDRLSSVEHKKDRAKAELERINARLDRAAPRGGASGPSTPSSGAGGAMDHHRADERTIATSRDGGGGMEPIPMAGEGGGAPRGAERDGDGRRVARDKLLLRHLTANEYLTVSSSTNSTTITTSGGEETSTDDGGGDSSSSSDEEDDGYV